MMTGNEEVKIVPVVIERKNILENLMSLYLHDLSEFADDLTVNKNGKFAYDGLELYFKKEALKPFFIYLKDEIIGFILFNSGNYVPKNIDCSVHEIFILKKYRRKGLCGMAVKTLLDHYSGTYRIEQLATNIQAIGFWKSFYKRYGIEYQSATEIMDDFECYTQVFKI